MKAALKRARSILHLRDPILAALLACELRDDTLSITAEYVPGMTLDRWIGLNALPAVGAASQLVERLAVALHTLHRMGVAHHALYPGKLIVLESGATAEDGTIGAKLRDLAVTTAMREWPPRLEAALFMAPESLSEAQWSAQAKASPRTSLEGRMSAGDVGGLGPESRIDPQMNVYSLGCLLHYLCTGQPPFPSVSVEQLQLAHTSAQAPAPRSINPSIPKDLEQTIVRALAFDRRERFATAAALATALAASDAPLRKSGVRPRLNPPPPPEPKSSSSDADARVDASSEASPGDQSARADEATVKAETDDASRTRVFWRRGSGAFVPHDRASSKSPAEPSTKDEPNAGPEAPGVRATGPTSETVMRSRRSVPPPPPPAAARPNVSERKTLPPPAMRELTPEPDASRERAVDATLSGAGPAQAVTPVANELSGAALLKAAIALAHRESLAQAAAAAAAAAEAEAQRAQQSLDSTRARATVPMPPTASVQVVEHEPSSPDVPSYEDSEWATAMKVARSRERLRTMIAEDLEGSEAARSQLPALDASEFKSERSTLPPEILDAALEQERLALEAEVAELADLQLVAADEVAAEEPATSDSRDAAEVQVEAPPVTPSVPAVRSPALQDHRSPAFRAFEQALLSMWEKEASATALSELASSSTAAADDLGLESWANVQAAAQRAYEETAAQAHSPVPELELGCIVGPAACEPSAESAQPQAAAPSSAEVQELTASETNIEAQAHPADAAAEIAEASAPEVSVASELASAFDSVESEATEIRASLSSHTSNELATTADVFGSELVAAPPEQREHPTSNPDRIEAVGLAAEPKLAETSDARSAVPAQRTSESDVSLRPLRPLFVKRTRASNPSLAAVGAPPRVLPLEPDSAHATQFATHHAGAVAANDVSTAAGDDPTQAAEQLASLRDAVAGFAATKPPSVRSSVANSGLVVPEEFVTRRRFAPSRALATPRRWPLMAAAVAALVALFVWFAGSSSDYREAVIASPADSSSEATSASVVTGPARPTETAEPPASASLESCPPAALEQASVPALTAPKPATTTRERPKRVSSSPVVAAQDNNVAESRAAPASAAPRPPSVLDLQLTLGPAYDGRPKASDLKPAVTTVVAAAIGSAPDTEARTAAPAGPQAARIENLSVRGSVSPIRVRHAVERIRPQLTRCYEQHLVSSERARLAAMRVDVVVSETGRVRSSDVRGAGSVAFNECMSSAARKLSFGSPDVGIVNVSLRTRYGAAPPPSAAGSLAYAADRGF